MVQSKWIRTIKYVATTLALSMSLSVFAPVVHATAPTGAVEQATTPKTSGTVANQKRYAPEKFRKHGITYKEFVEKNGEPKSAHLLIGTYLIDIVPKEPEKEGETVEEAVTGEIYQAAMTSRLTYSQEVSFYKSELAGGEWRDIDIATDISYIMTGTGVRVSDEEMDGMLITVYVSGGKMEPTVEEEEGDGRRVNPFLTPSPYNLDDMMAMKEILTIYNAGTLKYTAGSVESEDQVAENQSNMFLNDRLKYLFANDEKPDTLPIGEGDIELAAPTLTSLRTNLGREDSKNIESSFNDVEVDGVDRSEFLNDKEGTIGAAERMMFHFSDTRDALTDEMDDYVVGLWDLYLDYVDADERGDEELDVPYKDMYKVVYNLCATCDATRRGEAYFNLAANSKFHGTGAVLDVLEEMNTTGESPVGRNIANMSYYVPLQEPGLLEKAAGGVVSFFSNLFSGKDSTLGQPTGGFQSSEILADAITKARATATDNFVDFFSISLTRGITALTQLIYDDKTALLPMTARSSESDALILEIVYAEAIADGTPISDANEATLLSSKLIPSQNAILSQYLAQGLPERYNENGVNANEKGAMLAAQQTEAYNSEAAMEYLINALVRRETKLDVLTPIFTEQLAWVQNQKSVIKNTDYAVYAEEVRAKYEEFLKNTMKSLGIDVGDSDGDSLEKELEDALNLALANNDPKKAEAIKAIQDKLKKNPVEVPAGYTATITNDPSTGLPNVKFTPKKGSDASDLSGAQAGERGNASPGIGDGAGDGSNGSDGTVTPGSLDPDLDLLSKLEALLGTAFDDMGPDGKVELIAALNQYAAETGNTEVLDLAHTLLAQIMEENNPFVYAKYKGSTDMEYVSLAAVDRARVYTRYRLVTEKLDQTMSRIDAGLSFTYRYGDGEVRMKGGKLEPLTAKPTSQKDSYMKREADARFPYLDEEDSSVKLNVRAEYIINSPQGLVITGNMETRIKEIVQLIADIYK